jgi:outer membrane protein OmpA-like peptidoglycan-associated protein
MAMAADKKPSQSQVCVSGHGTMRKTFHFAAVAGTVIVYLAVILAAGAAEAQVSTNLRESPRDSQTETRKLVEVERSTINVRVWMNKSCGSPFYPNEKAVIFFTTDVDGYVTLYDIDTQGNVLVIFPNRHTPDNFVRSGQTLQIPAVEAGYDLIVEEPEGIEYIEALASTNPYYRWDHRQGQPRWLRDMNLERRATDNLEVGTMDQSTITAYKESDEYQNLPQGLGALGLQSLQNNFQTSRSLREQIHSKLIVTPREPEQQQTQTGSGQTQTVSDEPMQDYSTATCYFYVVTGQPAASAQPSSYQQDEYLRRQEQDFRQIPGLGTQRLEDRLLVQMPGNVLFASGSYMLHYEAQQALSRVAEILLNYPQTDVMVLGHTDSVGAEDYNRLLSESRARTVAEYLVSRGVQQYRISWIGYGETMPIASNDNEQGRQRNRRVELDIRVNPRYQ